jgi:adenosine tuberculosinyltransferase
MDFAQFQALATEEVARLVRHSGPKVVVFPINGTRRWFMLEHREQAAGDSAANYLRTTWQQQVLLYQLFFDHGVETLLTPIFGPDLLGRGQEYRQLVEPGLLWFTRDPALLAFYEQYDVRVRVYGDTDKYLAGTPYDHALRAFDDVARLTAGHQRHRLFFGVCAHDAAETVAAIGIRFHQEHGRIPTKEEIVAAYYGEPVGPVDVFIGFDRPAVFDMPLIAIGQEDLYFTVAPSPYLDRHTLRSILFDHLFTRPVTERYDDVGVEGWQALSELYQLNRHHVLGIGRRSADSSFWYPLPQVHLPAQLAQEGDRPFEGDRS